MPRDRKTKRSPSSKQIELKKPKRKTSDLSPITAEEIREREEELKRMATVSDKEAGSVPPQQREKRARSTSPNVENRLTLAEAMAQANKMDEGVFQLEIGRLVSAAAEAFNYQGFDPQVIRAEATKLFGENLNAVLVLVGGTVCLRGTNLNKILNKSSDELIAAWAPYKDKFKHRASGKYTNNELTLARMAASWPINMAMVANKVNRPIISALTVAPKLLISTVYAPISIKKEAREIHTLAERINLVFLLEFDKIINKKSPRPHDVVRYFKVAQANPLVSDEDRLKLFVRIKLEEKINLAMKDMAFNTFVTNYPIPY